jgi:carbamoyl-phosphate synthase large subunit
MVGIIRSAVGSLPGVGFINLLKDLGFYVIGTDISENIGAKFFTNAFFKVPVASDPLMISEYRKIIAKTQAEWIISGPESEIIQLANNSEILKEAGAKVFHPPIETLNIITDKWKSFIFLTSLRILVPNTIEAEEKLNIFDSDKYILKPKAGRGGTGIHVVNRKQDIELFYNLVDPKQYIIQEFIEGEEFTTDLLFDLEGRLLNLVTRKRLKTDSGISIISQTVFEAEIVEIIKILAKKLKFIGGNCIQFIKKDGQFYLTDINPRFGGGSILSIKSSDTFRENLVSLLSSRFEELKINSIDFQPMTMYRYYAEYYQS